MAPDDTRRVVAVVVAAPGSVARVVIILQLGKCRHSLVRQQLDACKLLRWHQLRTGRHAQPEDDRAAEGGHKERNA